MRRTFLLIAAIILLAASMLTSCQYKDLCYNHNHWAEPNLILKLNLKLDLDIDVQMLGLDTTDIKIPSHMVVCFYDTLSGNLRTMEIVGSYGGPLHVEPGMYDMVVYSFDTEFTQVDGDNNIDKLRAFTSDITDMKAPSFANFLRKNAESPSESDSIPTTDTEAPGPIIYTPDHLLVTRMRVEIPPYSTEEQVITIEATAATIVETYRFEVRNVTGIEYISKVEAFITNQARASYFGRGELSNEPATIFFEMETQKDSLTIKSTFTTFGKLPGESKSYLNLLVTDSEGNPYTIITDITDQFDSGGHSIVIQDSIIVPPPTTSGSGISPTVEPWDEENHDVQIG